MPITVGQLLVNDCLPQKFRDYTRVLDSNGLEDLLRKIAQEDPESYSEVTKKLMDVGNAAAFDTGVTLRLADCETKFDKRPFLKIVADAEKAIENDPSISDKDKAEAMGEVYDKVQSSIEKQVYDTELKAGNQLALQVASKARGSKNQLMSFISTPGNYSDTNGKRVPLFIQHSFAEGLTPAEYWAGSYGVRLSTVQCLTPDTEVLMADWSVKPIGIIRPGDIVMGATREGKMYPTRVTHFFDNGIQPVYEFKFRKFGSKSEFLSVKATDSHKMLGTKARYTKKPQKKWFPQADLLQLSLATTPKSKNSDFRLSLARGCLSSVLLPAEHHPEALLLGLLTGDGCVTHPNFTFSCADKTLISDITPYLETLGLRLTKSNSAGYTWNFNDIIHSNHGVYKAVASFSGREHKFANKNRVVVWEELGDRHSYDKVLPMSIWSWDDQSVIAYINGIIATDGCIHSQRMKDNGKYTREKHTEGFILEMTSENVVRGVMQLLRRRFGIYGTEVQKVWRVDKGRPTYKFYIHHPEMVKKFKELFSTVPGERRIKLEKLNPVISHNSPRVECSAYSKTYIGDVPTVDIEVESEDHMFVLANGLISSNSKIATAKGGAFGKLLSQSANNQVVVMDDCGGASGVPMPVDDDDNLGAVLAHKAGRYPAGTVITKSVLSDLRKDKNNDEIVIRSPITCGCKSGVCSRCAGIRETGDFPPIGYNLGTNAASAFAERVTQGSLNVKHSGRMNGGSTRFSGFGMFSSLAKVPKSYPDKAILSSIDGEVVGIKPAPQGGQYVVISDGSADKEHYVSPGYKILVKEGDKLEAGDQLSDGVINPAELVDYKGIGEARKYWAQRFIQGFRDSGMKGNRRNAEVLAKTLINNVELEDEDESGLPGDVTTYTKWAFGYRPRKDTKLLKPDQARNMYLEQPVLHYTIGTRITPSVIKTLSKFGQDRIFANANRPNARAFMQRVEDSNAVRDDWMARLGTTYLKDRLVEDAQRGAESHLHTTEPSPGLAKGVEFGNWGKPGSKNKSPTFTY